MGYTVRMNSPVMCILLVLPMAFQDGIEKYNGIMRYLKQHGLDWRIRLDRLTPSLSRPMIGEHVHFNGTIIDGTASTGLIRAYAATSLPLVALDRAQMEQVFFNLIKNALEAMKDGGEISVYLDADDDCVSASVRDAGNGMDQATLAALFEPYRTTKSRGTGLGLMLSRRIVRAHGGEIDVETKAGEGTKFTVRIPRLEKRVRRLT